MRQNPQASTTENRLGTLFVVATPIGNMEDITLRAIRVLGEVDFVAAEDTRHTLKLLRHHNISAKLVSYHDHNEEQRSPELIQHLRQGRNIALVSSAGTPTVSDPGFRLIRKCAEENINVAPVPGVSSAVAAICASGLPTDSFVFLGFAPRKKGKREIFLDSLANHPRTLIFFESPRRIATLLDDLIATLGDRNAVLAREMTKIHEEFVRGTLSQIKDHIQQGGELKGECTLLAEGAGSDARMTEEQLGTEIRKAMEKSDEKLSAAVKTISSRYGISRKRVYDEALKIKDEKRNKPR